jgi:hypothetical protein
LAFWVILPIQVELWLPTGRLETSVLNTLSAGNIGQVVPGTGSAAAPLAPATANVAQMISASEARAAIRIRTTFGNGRALGYLRAADQSPVTTARCRAQAETG